MCILGIDPGLKGGIAIIDSTAIVLAKPMPLVGKEIDTRAIGETIKQFNVTLAVIEKVHSMPGQGVASMFRFGMGYGMVKGALSVLSIPTQLVTPQAWKKVVLAGTKKNKNAAIEFVAMRYPSVNLTPGRIRKPHDGIADAVCLAAYGSII